MRRAAALILVLASCRASEEVAVVGPSASTAPPAAPSASAPPSSAIDPPNGDPLSPDALMDEVRFLASPDLRGRGSASDDERRAARHLVEKVEAIGLAPVGPNHEREQTFDTPSGKSSNVFGVIHAAGRSPDGKVVVVGAHFDHLGQHGKDVYFGADDNASGVAGVLGAASAIAKRKNELGRDIVVVFFGAEEIGLRGSQAFVASGPLAMHDVFAMVNVDMIGRPLSDQPLLRPVARLVGIDPDHSVGVDGLRGRKALDAAVRKACDDEHERAITVDDLPEDLRGTAEMMTRGRGDNWSFEAAGVPAVFFSSAESSDYHQPTDTIETLSPELLAERARIVERTVVALSNLPSID